MDIERIGKRSRHAKSSISAGVALLIIVLVVVVAYYNGWIPGHSPTTISLANNNAGNSIPAGTGGASNSYLGFYWNSVPGTIAAPSAVSWYAFPAGNPSGAFGLSSIAVTTQKFSPGTTFGFSQGYYEQIYSTSAYPQAQYITGPSTTNGQSISFPGYSDQTSFVSSGCGLSTNPPCINTVSYYPDTITNATTSVTAIESTIIPGFSGTTIPSTTFTLTFNFQGVSSSHGGAGLTQLGSGSVLAGIPNQPITAYAGGSAITTPVGTIIPSQSVDYIQSNNTNLALNSCGPGFTTTGLQSGQITVTAAGPVYSKTAVWYVLLTGAAVTASNANTSPAYVVAQFTCSFTNNGIATGHFIAIVNSATDDQQASGFDNFHLSNGAGLTGTPICSSVTTTNMCDNSTDITVGTYQAIAGFPVPMGGGGSGSGTLPGWFTPTTGPNGAWATLAPDYTMQGGTVVYRT